MHLNPLLPRAIVSDGAARRRSPALRHYFIFGLSFFN